MSDLKYYWWCENCQIEVDNGNVTFEETHDTCGCDVIVLKVDDSI